MDNHCERNRTGFEERRTSNAPSSVPGRDDAWSLQPSCGLRVAAEHSQRVHSGFL